MIYVIATIEVAQGHRDAFLKEFNRNVPNVLAEEGCIEYGPNIDVHTGIGAQLPLRDRVVTIVEKWESVDALKAHLATPHMAEYRSRVKGMVHNVTLQVLQPAST